MKDCNFSKVKTRENLTQYVRKNTNFQTFGIISAGIITKSWNIFGYRKTKLIKKKYTKKNKIKIQQSTNNEVKCGN